jgi:hypothetical protein
MKIFRGTLSDIWTPTFTEPDFASQYHGNYSQTYAAQGIVREGGVTKMRTKPLDLSRYRELGVNRNFALYSHVNGSNQATGTDASKGVTISYQCAPASSGATWTTIATLRGSGTSISGTSGTAMTAIGNPCISPFWRLEFSVARAHSTSTMQVDWALIAE